MTEAKKSANLRCAKLRRLSAERRARRAEEKLELAAQRAKAKELKKLATKDRTKAKAAETRGVQPLTAARRQLKALLADEPGAENILQHSKWEHRCAVLKRRLAVLNEAAAERRKKNARNRELSWHNLVVFTAAQHMAETAQKHGKKSAQYVMALATHRDAKHREKMFKAGTQLTQEEAAMAGNDEALKLHRKKQRDRRKMEANQQRSRDTVARLREMKGDK